ncbi:hypothetical protein OG393_30775 [Streptomyces sp. NBC_01216]|uniref:hypothetical protein n=1 Tax=Streptomyces sp. NBC_01216 TaxID=2903778 RepID=UPI002E0DCB87|nr:hypothetical protein OG393_30775 [Streptomyces sp. NBC_01216]
MSPWKTTRPRVDHQATAARAVAAAGRWVFAGTYGSSYTADSMARLVRTGSGRRMTAYDPAGAYDAYTERVDDGHALYVRHVRGEHR